VLDPLLFSEGAGPPTLRPGLRWGARRGRKTRVLRLEWTTCANVAASFRVIASPTGLVGRNELMLAAANQVCPAHAPQGFTKDRPVIGIVIAQKCLVQPAHLQPLGDTHFFARPRADSGMDFGVTLKTR